MRVCSFAAHSQIAVFQKFPERFLFIQRREPEFEPAIRLGKAKLHSRKQVGQAGLRIIQQQAGSVDVLHLANDTAMEILQPGLQAIAAGRD